MSALEIVTADFHFRTGFRLIQRLRSPCDGDGDVAAELENKVWGRSCGERCAGRSQVKNRGIPLPPQSLGIIGLARNSPQNPHNKGLRGHNPENKGVTYHSAAMKLCAALLREQDRRLGLWMTRSDVTRALIFLKLQTGESPVLSSSFVLTTGLRGTIFPCLSPTPAPPRKRCNSTFIGR